MFSLRVFNIRCRLLEVLLVELLRLVLNLLVTDFKHEQDAVLARRE
jgi:hypothetical protein